MAHHTSRVVTSILIVTSCASLASAQIVTGVPGSPSATTTIDGKQLPPPPTKFGGAVKQSYLDSTPYWPPRHHSVGTGVIGELATGYPGYDSIIGPQNATFRNTTQVFPWIGKPGCNLITDIADDAIAHLRELNAAAPDKPPHMAAQWAWAFDTPFKWAKQVASHFGGTRQGLAISWPGHIAKMPDTLTEMQTLFATEAGKYNVLSLDNRGFARPLVPKPSATAWRTVFTYTGENTGIPLGNVPSILDKDHMITADVTIPKEGAEAMIVTLGGRFGGYGLYLPKGKPVFVYNLLDLERFRWEGGVGLADWLGDSLKAGKHTIAFDFKYDAPGPGKGGTGVLSVDGTGQRRSRTEIGGGAGLIRMGKKEPHEGV